MIINHNSVIAVGTKPDFSRIVDTCIIFVLLYCTNITPGRFCTKLSLISENVVVNKNVIINKQS